MSQNSEATLTMTAAAASGSQRIPEPSLRTLILHSPSMSLSLQQAGPFFATLPAGSIQISLSGDITVQVKRRPIPVAVAWVAGGIVGVAADAGAALGTAVATVEHLAPGQG